MKRKIKKPLDPYLCINKEHSTGPIIAPSPNIICKPAPAATNFSLETKSFTYAKFKLNSGRDIPA